MTTVFHSVSVLGTELVVAYLRIRPFHRAHTYISTQTDPSTFFNHALAIPNDGELCVVAITKDPSKHLSHHYKGRKSDCISASFTHRERARGDRLSSCCKRSCPLPKRSNRILHSAQRAKTKETSTMLAQHLLSSCQAKEVYRTLSSGKKAMVVRNLPTAKGRAK